MHREFNITLADSNAISIWDAIVAAGYCDNLGNTLVSAVKDFGILPDRVQELAIKGITVATTFQILDQFSTTGDTQAVNVSVKKTSNRNSICLKEYKLKGTANDVVNVSVESI